MTSALSALAKSNKPTTTRLAGNLIYLPKNGIAVVPITCANSPNRLSRSKLILLYDGIFTSLQTAILYNCCVSNKIVLNQV